MILAVSIGVVGVFAAALAYALFRERKTRSEARSHRQAILRAIPDLMFLLSADGVYLDFHGDRKQLFMPPEQFLGKRMRDVMPPDLAERFEESFKRARTSQEVQVVEYSLPIDGEENVFEARMVECDDASILCMVRDTTASRRTEKSLFTAGLELQQSHQHARDLAGRLIVSQELERARIARDLHDDLGQKLALLSIELDRLTRGRQGVETALVQDLKARINEISTDVHRLSYELHPSKLATLGLVAAIDSCCRDMSRQHGLAVSFRRDNVPPGIDGEVALCLYRVVQEALHNIIKHSGASAAEVWLTSDGDEVELRIADRGRGFTMSGDRQGLGLVSMRERVQFFNGRFIVRSSPGSGTRIGARIPLAVPSVKSSGQQIA